MGLPGLLGITIYARQPLRPRWKLYVLTIPNIYYCLLLTQWHQLPFLHLTRLNQFTLPHSGSHIPRPTLKPNITALAPRSRYQLLVRLYWVGIPPTLYQASIGTHCVYSLKASSFYIFHMFLSIPFFYFIYLYISQFLLLNFTLTFFILQYFFVIFYSTKLSTDIILPFMISIYFIYSFVTLCYIIIVFFYHLFIHIYVDNVDNSVNNSK